MKGLISGIKRMEIHDGRGIRTTVFFKGCPMKCIWCHNPEGISFSKQYAKFGEKCIGCGTCKGNINEATAEICPTNAQIIFGKEYDVEELVQILKKDLPFFKKSGGGVTLSGGECLSQPEFAKEVARLLVSNGISVYIDTCGFVPKKVLEDIIPYTDVFLYDIKAISEYVHIKCTGVSNKIILENLRYLVSSGKKVEIRIPYVPGYNSSEIEKIAKFIADLDQSIPVKVLAYHNFAGSKYNSLEMNNTLPQYLPSKEEIEEAENILKRYNLIVK